MELSKEVVVQMENIRDVLLCRKPDKVRRALVMSQDREVRLHGVSVLHDTLSKKRYI